MFIGEKVFHTGRERSEANKTQQKKSALDSELPRLSAKVIKLSFPSLFLQQKIPNTQNTWFEIIIEVF